MSGQTWSIGLARAASPLSLQAGVPAVPILTAAQVTDVDAGFVADPFLLRRGERWHLFFEVWNRTADKGEIALADSADLVQWTYRGIVLRERWHLSYPHVFEHGGEVWMVPEAIEGGGVSLYRADPFPTGWRRIATLVDAAVADPTPFAWRGDWYLFACPDYQRHDGLVLYTSRQLDGGWRLHPASPLTSGDARRSRPAGRVHFHEERPLRWAQDCHPCYGSAVRGFEVLALSPTRYAERELSTSPVLAAGDAFWNLGGMHHLDVQRWPEGGRDRWVAACDGFRIETPAAP